MLGEKEKRERINPLYERIFSAAELFRLTAWQFSYPAIDQAIVLTSREFLEAEESFLKAAAKEKNFLTTEFSVLKKLCVGEGSKKRALEFRQEHTRLFDAPPILIPLCGGAWVREKTLISQKKGESFAVGQYYKELGLGNKEKVGDPYDHLISELDFISYVTLAEAKAWKENDSTSAKEWRVLREEFFENHFEDFAEQVSLEIQRETKNPFIRLSAQILITLTRLPI